jgi:diguanylate cyclase (GGDEF)-like protein
MGQEGADEGERSARPPGNARRLRRLRARRAAPARTPERSGRNRPRAPIGSPAATSTWTECDLASLDTGLCDAVHPKERPRVRFAAAAVVEEQRRWEMDIRTVGAGGGWRHQQLLLEPIAGEARLRFLLEDVEDEHRRHSRATWEAFHDPLTGLPNRALLAERLALALAAQERTGAQVGVLFCDLDRFKAVNDTLGHLAGDRVLVEIAHRMRDMLRPDDTIARFGGDEFVVVTPGVTDEDIDIIAGRLGRAVAAPVDLGGGVLADVGLSVGVATAPPGEGIEDLLGRADTALFEAKARGRGTHVRFDEALRARLDRLDGARLALGRAMDRPSVELHYQPIVDLPSGRVVAVEALFRTDDPRARSAEVIAVAETTGVIVALGFDILRCAVRQLRAWDEERGAEAAGAMAMSVNVSARQLEASGFDSGALAVLGDAGVDPRRLVLEIGEVHLGGLSRTARRGLATLREAGVRIAVDDFGTGYSSLAYLRRFPVDTIKIDRSFITAISESPEASALIRTLIQLGKSLGLETLAEGIEESNQSSFLQMEQCDSGQGFLYSRPLNVDAMERFLATDPAVTHARPPVPIVVAT